MAGLAEAGIVRAGGNAIHQAAANDQAKQSPITKQSKHQSPSQHTLLLANALRLCSQLQRFPDCQLRNVGISAVEVDRTAEQVKSLSRLQVVEENGALKLTVIGMSCSDVYPET